MRPQTLPDFIDDHLAVHPIASATTLPAAWYRDPVMEALDLEVLFYQQWIYVCAEAQGPQTGQTQPFSIGGAPMLLSRDAAGELRALHAVCRHRGGPLALVGGDPPLLQCGYHGWTYKLNGDLVSARELGPVESFDKANFCLPQARVHIWRGMVFVNLASEPLEFEQWAGDITHDEADDSTHLAFGRRDTYDIACNWKVYVDNFLEGYHLPFVHPSLSDLLDYQHYETVLGTWSSLQHTPLAGSDGLYTASGGEARYYFLYPATMLNMLPGRVQVNQALPAGPQSCQVVFDYYYIDGTDAKVIADDRAAAEAIQQEDITICEQVQSGLGSPSYTAGRYSVLWETGVHHFHSLLRTAYRKSA